MRIISRTSRTSVSGVPHRSVFHYLRLTAVVAIAVIVLAGCPNPTQSNVPDDSTQQPGQPNNQTPSGVVVPTVFWGSWLGIGSEVTWYISGGEARINGFDAGLAAASATRLDVENGYLELDSENVVRYYHTGTTLPEYLYRSSGAVSSFRAGVTQRDTGLGASSAASLASIRVIVENLNNPANTQELVTDSEGQLMADEIVVGDNYSIRIPQQDRVPTEVEAVVTPVYDGQNLGVVDILNTGANFKMNVSLGEDVRPDLLFADGVTVYPITISITNIGVADLEEANYSISSPDGIEFVSGMTASILGTVFARDFRTVELGIRVPEILTDFEDRNLVITVTSIDGSLSWTDQISLRFRRAMDTFTIHTLAQSGQLSGLVIDPEGVPVRVGTGATTFSWKPGEYVVAFAGTGTGTETRFALGIDVPVWPTWEALASTAYGEPNNSPETATQLGYRQRDMQYLGARDVDFFRFELPVDLLNISSSVSPGIHFGPQAVSMAPNISGAAVRYTTDFSLPSETHGTLYTGGTLSVAADEPLYAYVYLDGYHPQLLYLIDRPRMVAVEGGSYAQTIMWPNFTVTLSDFSIMNTEVTQAQWNVHMDTNPSSFNSGDDAPNRPVERVTWYEAIVYANRRSISESLIPVYTISGSTNPNDWGAIPTSSDATWNAVTMNMNVNGYRLPTKAEFRFAMMGGNLSRGFQYAGGDNPDTVGWHLTNSGETTHVVGQLAANELGLYDLGGNVWEWVWDWYENPLTGGYQVDPTGPSSGLYRLNHGGGFTHEDRYLQPHYGSNNLFRPGEGAFHSHGLRLVRRPGSGF